MAPVSRVSIGMVCVGSYLFESTEVERRAYLLNSTAEHTEDSGLEV